MHAYTYIQVCVFVPIQVNTFINSYAMTPTSAHLVMPDTDHAVGRVGPPHVDLEGSHADPLVAMVKETGKNVKQGRLGQDQSLERSGSGGTGRGEGQGLHCMHAEYEVHYLEAEQSV